MSQILQPISYKLKARKGFTLIELLVVIAIISILSLVIYASVDQARKKTRDDSRLSSLMQMKAAIEIYGHANGRYPAIGCSRTSWTGHGSGYGSCTEYIAGLEALISPLPVDPNNTTYGFIYYTNSTGTEYKLMSFNVLESKTIDINSEYARYPSGCSGSMTGSATKTYAVYSAGAKCW